MVIRGTDWRKVFVSNIYQNFVTGTSDNLDLLDQFSATMIAMENNLLLIPGKILGHGVETTWTMLFLVVEIVHGLTKLMTLSDVDSLPLPARIIARIIAGSLIQVMKEFKESKTPLFSFHLSCQNLDHGTMFVCLPGSNTVFISLLILASH